MRLFLHIGTEKTGSSFLQTIAARNRSDLLKAGVFYPLPKKRRRDLLQGRVSPGNGAELKELLNAGRSYKVKAWLSDLEGLASKSGATAVLLSNEQFLDELAREKKFEILLESCSQAGFGSVEVMLVLRDPIEQCLSLYRHRSKHGNTAPLEQWLSGSFQLSQLLRGLDEAVNRFGCSVNVMRYSTDGSILVRKFFNEWLKLDLGAFEDVSVNRSLTFSDLEVIRAARSLEPKLVPFIFERLDGVDPADKANDIARARWARAIAQTAVFSQSDAWSSWNHRLPVDDQLSIPTCPGENIPEPVDIVLSTAQAAAVLRVTRDAASLAFRFRLLVFRIRRSLGRLVRRNAT